MAELNENDLDREEWLAFGVVWMDITGWMDSIAWMADFFFHLLHTIAFVVVIVVAFQHLNQNILVYFINDCSSTHHTATVAEKLLVERQITTNTTAIQRYVQYR